MHRRKESGESPGPWPRSLASRRALWYVLRHSYKTLKTDDNEVMQSNLVPRPTSIWNPWFIASFFLLQFIIIIFMYRCVFLLRFHNSFLTCVVIRLSVKYAKHQFLTTYFDPFYADLHLHRDKPHANYDPKIFTFFNNTPSADSPHFALRLFRKASSAIWNGLTGTVARWQRSAWDAWGAPSNPMQTKRVAWPPS